MATTAARAAGRRRVLFIVVSPDRQHPSGRS
jgi:hypothetical protein